MFFEVKTVSWKNLFEVTLLKTYSKLATTQKYPLNDIIVYLPHTICFKHYRTELANKKNV